MPEGLTIQMYLLQWVSFVISVPVRIPHISHLDMYRHIRQGKKWLSPQLHCLVVHTSTLMESHSTFTVAQLLFVELFLNDKEYVGPESGPQLSIRLNLIKNNSVVSKTEKTAIQKPSSPDKQRKDSPDIFPLTLRTQNRLHLFFQIGKKQFLTIE